MRKGWGIVWVGIAACAVAAAATILMKNLGFHDLLIGSYALTLSIVTIHILKRFLRK